LTNPGDFVIREPMNKTKSSGSNKGGIKKRGLPSKRELYQQVAGKADELIARLFELAYSKNESVAVSASRVLIERVLPTLKSQEISGHQEKTLGVIILPPLKK